jgi:hypothetical protein
MPLLILSPRQRQLHAPHSVSSTHPTASAPDSVSATHPPASAPRTRQRQRHAPHSVSATHPTASAPRTRQRQRHAPDSVSATHPTASVPRTRQRQFHAPDSVSSTHPPASAPRTRQRQRVNDLHGVRPVPFDDALGADAVAEERVGMVRDVAFELVPALLVVADLLAVAADRDEAAEGLDAAERVAQLAAWACSRASECCLAR